MSSAQRWGERDTLKLIELYKKYKFLWDCESELYKNATARRKAFEKIVKELDIPGITSADVRSKIKNLRTAYYQEKRKLAIARANNKVLKPLRWFNAFKSVMSSIYSRKVGDGETNSEESEVSEEELESVVPSENIMQSDSFLEVVPCNDSDTYVVSIKQEFLDEMDNLGDKSMTPTIGDYLEPVSAPKRTKIETSKIVESPRNVQRKIRKVQKKIEPKREKPLGQKKIDEFQMFANNIAHQLRKLPLPRALNLQIEVQSLIAKERIELFSKQVENENTQDEESS